MARGKLCLMRRTPSGRTHYNHQTWSGGRNVVKHVPPDKLPALRKAVAGHTRLLELVDEYADAVSKRTKI